MKSNPLVRERLAWAAALVALAVSASWLAAINAALILKLTGSAMPEAFVVARALARAAWLVIRECAPIAPLAFLIPGLAILFARALRGDAPFAGKVRHV